MQRTAKNRYVPRIKKGMAALDEFEKVIEEHRLELEKQATHTLSFHMHTVFPHASLRIPSIRICTDAHTRTDCSTRLTNRWHRSSSRVREMSR